MLFRPDSMQIPTLVSLGLVDVCLTALSMCVSILMRPVACLWKTLTLIVGRRLSWWWKLRCRGPRAMLVTLLRCRLWLLIRRLWTLLSELNLLTGRIWKWSLVLETMFVEIEKPVVRSWWPRLPSVTPRVVTWLGCSLTVILG